MTLTERQCANPHCHSSKQETKNTTTHKVNWVTHFPGKGNTDLEQFSYLDSSNRTEEVVKDDEMLVRGPQGAAIAVDPRSPPVIYAYAGPPSIQMATWGDRSSRSSRARSAHSKEQSKDRTQFLRSMSAGGGYMAPPIPPPPAGYPHPAMYSPVVLVPQPFVSPVPPPPASLSSNHQPPMAAPIRSYNHPIMLDQSDSSDKISKSRSAYRSLQPEVERREDRPRKTSSNIGIKKKSSKEEVSKYLIILPFCFLFACFYIFPTSSLLSLFLFLFFSFFFFPFFPFFFPFFSPFFPLFSIFSFFQFFSFFSTPFFFLFSDVIFFYFLLFSPLFHHFAFFSYFLSIFSQSFTFRSSF